MQYAELVFRWIHIVAGVIWIVPEAKLSVGGPGAAAPGFIG